MEVVVVGSIIQVVLQHLLSLMEEIKLVRFKKDLTKLKDSLLMITDLLDLLSVAEVQQAGKEAVKLWLERLENVAFEADAILDEFNKEIQQREKKQIGEINKVMRFFSTVSSNMLFNIKMTRKIKDVNKKLELINKKAKGFSLDHMANPVEQVLPVEQQIDSFLIEPNVVGREDDVSKIVEKLISAPPEETLPVVSIVGMGGIGKTTLAQKIFHHENIRDHFAERIWVDVAGYLNEMCLLSMILEKIASEEEDDDVIVTKEVVLSKILEHLQRKRYLLVLDDVWNEMFEKLDDFVSLLSKINSVKGNCIIITTRKENIFSVVKRLSGVSNDECWSIVKSKVLPRANVQTNFERIGKCIAQRCGGSTLVAEEVGSLLHGKSIDEWLFILENQLSNFGPDHENHIRKTLKFIYNHLPSSRKKRFAYCSIFPDEITIKREHLVMLWMAEEYLQAGHGNDIGIVGNRFFNYLLQKLLFPNVESGKLPQWIGELSCLSSNDSGADIGATIHVVLQNLLSLSFEEIKAVFGFKKDLTKLENSLIMIREVMSDPEVSQTNDSAIKSWLEQLEVVVFEADAILYEFSYEHLRKIVKNQNRETKKVMSVLPFSTNLLFSREMTRKLKDVNEKLEMTSKHVDRLGLEMSVIKSIQPPFWGF